METRAYKYGSDPNETSPMLGREIPTSWALIPPSDREYDPNAGQTDDSSAKYYDGVTAYGGSGTGTSTGGGQEVVASSEGITEASQSLLSCANELSDIFDGIAVVTDSIGTNVTGFESIETFVSQLRQINSTKDSLISKIKEFGNYLTSTVTTGYDAFIKALGSIKMDTSSISSLISLLTGKSLGGNTFNSGTVEDKDGYWYGSSGGTGGGSGSGNGGSSGDSETGNTIPPAVSSLRSEYASLSAQVSILRGYITSGDDVIKNQHKLDEILDRMDEIEDELSNLGYPL